MFMEDEESKIEAQPIKKRPRGDQSNHEVCVQFTIGRCGFFVKPSRKLYKAKRNTTLSHKSTEVNLSVPDSKEDATEELDMLFKKAKI